MANYFLLGSLMDRLTDYWGVTEDEIAYKLYEEYYTRCLDDGLFTLEDFDPMVIVDNDWVNWLSVMTDDDGTVCHLVRM